MYSIIGTSSNCTLDLCRPLRGFDLVKDKDTGNSKGYGFCVYQVNNQNLETLDLDSERSHVTTIVQLCD